MENKPWKYNNLLNDDRKLKEKLICADIDRLWDEIEKDSRPNLKKLLSTPLKKLDPKYRNLYTDEQFKKNKEKTLYEIITERIRYKSLKAFYSETADNYLEGFACYQVDEFNKIVYDIVLFTFDPDNSNFTLAKDMINLIRDLKKNYDKIMFECSINQPVLESYKKITLKFGGHYMFDDKKGVWEFEIPGEK